MVAHLFSSIDLIHDPIPVLGYLDDLALMPLGNARPSDSSPRTSWRNVV